MVDFKNKKYLKKIVLLSALPFLLVPLFYLISIPQENSSTATYEDILQENSYAATYEDILEERFSILSVQSTNVCGGTSYIEPKADNESLQGSCCSRMDFHRYTEQVEGLKRYSLFDKVPADPYDIPVLLAKELLDYQENIILTSEQQIIYDDATNISQEGGPCCCKCWRWHAFEGQAKYLITEHNFKAEQIAEIWDLEDGCGGTGHVHNNDHA